jgi:peptide/nickel transport system permease protein
MLKYIARRLGTALIVFFMVTLVIFFSIHLIINDPLRPFLILQIEPPLPIDDLREFYGLNDNIGIQYLRWLSNALRGNLGLSINYHWKWPPFEVSGLVGQRLPFTIGYSFAVFVLSCLISLVTGAGLRVKRRAGLINIFSVLANFIICIPIFFLILLLILMVRYTVADFAALAGFGRWVAITAPGIIAFVLMMAAFIIKYVFFDYLRPESRPSGEGQIDQEVTYGQALKAGIIPLLKRSGLIMNIVLSGMLLVEFLAAIPGLNRLFIDGIYAQDYNVIQGVTLVIAGMFILFNLIMDIIKKWVEPKLAKYTL